MSSSGSASSSVSSPVSDLGTGEISENPVSLYFGGVGETVSTVTGSGTGASQISENGSVSSGGGFTGGGFSSSGISGAGSGASNGSSWSDGFSSNGTSVSGNFFDWIGSFDSSSRGSDLSFSSTGGPGNAITVTSSGGSDFGVGIGETGVSGPGGISSSDSGGVSAGKFFW